MASGSRETNQPRESRRGTRNLSTHAERIKHFRARDVFYERVANAARWGTRDQLPFAIAGWPAGTVGSEK